MHGALQILQESHAGLQQAGERIGWRQGSLLATLLLAACQTRFALLALGLAVIVVGRRRNGIGRLLHGLHELGQPAAAQEHFLGAAVEHAGEQRFLETQHRQHPFLDGPLRNKVDYLHRPFLSQAMYPANALFQHRGVPGQVHVDHDRGELQVQTHAACIGCQEKPAFGIVTETVDQVLALGTRDAAVEEDEFPAALTQRRQQHLVHAQPLAENDCFRFAVLE